MSEHYSPDSYFQDPEAPFPYNLEEKLYSWKTQAQPWESYLNPKQWCPETLIAKPEQRWAQVSQASRLPGKTKDGQLPFKQAAGKIFEEESNILFCQRPQVDKVPNSQRGCGFLSWGGG